MCVWCFLCVVCSEFAWVLCMCVWCVVSVVVSVFCGFVFVCGVSVFGVWVEFFVCFFLCLLEYLYLCCGFLCVFVSK